ncbi:hypothetical protein cyc_03740 [Cyclospora cayetanensis]|uniref:Uncharacterized protein n=1 Tax=Cyclospora cayetanensis TaxID=88456 RepID=A0A1D3D927_9EIME|nr:hypothetical protein cyc_03740 [Cyclospora cayetanensis]
MRLAPVFAPSVRASAACTAFLASAVVLLSSPIVELGLADTEGWLSADEAALHLHVLQMEFPLCFYSAVVHMVSRQETAASTVVECKELCYADLKCDKFSFDSTAEASSACSLMQKSAFESSVPNNGITGLGSCTDSCKEEGLVQGLLVRVIADGSVSTLQECLDLCVESEPCVYASFDYTTDVCWLRGEKAGETLYKPGAVSAAKRCGLRDSSVTVDLAIVGAEDLNSADETESWELCRSNGQIMPTARYFSWDSESKVCSLFDSSAKGLFKKKEGTMAGPTWPFQSPCYVPDVRIPTKAASEGTYAMSPLHCQRLCLDAVDCEFFSYREETGECFHLGGSTSKDVALEAATGWVAGPPKCETRDWCTVQGMYYSGGTISDIVMAGTEVCRNKCRANKDCAVWGYNHEKNLCSLMREAALQKVGKGSKFVSGLPQCGSPRACEMNEQDLGLSRHLEDIEQVTDAVECSNACHAQPRCYSFSLLEGNCIPIRVFYAHSKEAPSLPCECLTPCMLLSLVVAFSLRLPRIEPPAFTAETPFKLLPRPFLPTRQFVSASLPTMRLRVRTLGSEECEVHIQPEDTVRDLKRKIEQQIPRMQTDKQKLVHAGKVLDDKLLIKQYPQLKDNERLVVLVTKSIRNLEEMGFPPAAVRVALRAAFNNPDRAVDYLMEVLRRELGKDWRRHFQSFDLQPFAAASIGQVHRAVLTSGTQVAVKLQFPGVGESIRSDIRNLLLLLRLFGGLAPSLFVDQLSLEMQRELLAECNYLNEMQYQRVFKFLVERDFHGRLGVPTVVEQLTTKHLLTAEFINGRDRNTMGRLLLRLVLREIFIYRLINTVGVESEALGRGVCTLRRPVQKVYSLQWTA